MTSSPSCCDKISNMNETENNSGELLLTDKYPSFSEKLGLCVRTTQSHWQSTAAIIGGRGDTSPQHLGGNILAPPLDPHQSDEIAATEPVDMLNFKKFKFLAADRLQVPCCIILPNFCQAGGEIWHFFRLFQYGGHRNLGFSKIRNFNCWSALQG